MPARQRVEPNRFLSRCKTEHKPRRDSRCKRNCRRRKGQGRSNHKALMGNGVPGLRKARIAPCRKRWGQNRERPRSIVTRRGSAMARRSEKLGGRTLVPVRGPETGSAAHASVPLMERRYGHGHVVARGNCRRAQFMVGIGCAVGRGLDHCAGVESHFLVAMARVFCALETSNSRRKTARLQASCINLSLDFAPPDLATETFARRPETARAVSRRTDRPLSENQTFRCRRPACGLP